MTDFALPADLQNGYLNSATQGYVAQGSMGVHSGTVSTLMSSWQVPNSIGSGSPPTTWATTTWATPGSLAYGMGKDPVSGSTNRLLSFQFNWQYAGGNVLADRLGHMGGLSGTVTSAQTVSGTLTTPSGTGRCASNGSDVLWFLEWYTATGSTGVTATISYTNQSGTSGKTTTVSIPASTSSDTLIPINVLASGDTSIQSIQSVTLSGSTGTAGNFGVTALKVITTLDARWINVISYNQLFDHYQLGMPSIATGCCPFLYTASGASGYTSAWGGPYIMVVGGC